MPLKLALTAGQRNDKIGWPLLREPRDERAECAECALADKGYDSNKIRVDLQEIGVEAVISPTKSRVAKLEYDTHIYAHRHDVKYFNSKIKWFHRVFTRFDARADVYLGFVALASCLVWMF